MLASDTLIQAEGWSKEFELADNSKTSQEHLDFAHDVASIFATTEGQRVLKAMVQKYMVSSVPSSTDTVNNILLKEGSARVVRYILSQIELSNNTK